MIGHGAQRVGGDKDLVALWEAEENKWWTNEDYYTLPQSLASTDLPTLESYEKGLDGRDGVTDGLWFGHTLEELQEATVRPGTPAFVRFTGDAAVNMLRDEDIGTDDVTDFMWVEMKAPDFGGHAWNMENSEVGDVLYETDRQLARFKRTLDEKVGEGNYVIAVSADHGQQPIPETYGGWRINTGEFERDIQSRFGDVVEKITTVDIFIDEDSLETEGVSMDDIASFIGTYTIGENIPEGAPGSDLVPTGRLDETLFAGAVPTEYLQSLSPESIDSFGPGDYPEGDLTVGDS
ncbi:MAG: alkaline phosphatase family protein, partial [Actinobacteria bacterium]|nr:alkaline phosphatase family protein [Actinomycetota bacterium]